VRKKEKEKEMTYENVDDLAVLLVLEVEAEELLEGVEVVLRRHEDAEDGLLDGRRHALLARQLHDLAVVALERLVDLIAIAGGAAAAAALHGPLVKVDLGKGRADEPPAALAREERVPRRTQLLALVLALEQLLHHRLHLAHLRRVGVARLPGQEIGW
jgi:hypothetical protein